MDEVEIENSTNPENPENDQPQKAKYAIQVQRFGKTLSLSMKFRPVRTNKDILILLKMRWNNSDLESFNLTYQF